VSFLLDVLLLIGLTDGLSLAHRGLLTEVRNLGYISHPFGKGMYRILGNVYVPPLLTFRNSSETSTVPQIEGPDWMDFTQAIPVRTTKDASRHCILSLLYRLWPSLLPCRLT